MIFVSRLPSVLADDVYLGPTGLGNRGTTPRLCKPLQNTSKISGPRYYITQFPRTGSRYRCDYRVRTL